MKNHILAFLACFTTAHSLPSDLELPAKLAPTEKLSLRYLDSAMRLDTMGHEEYRDLGDPGRARMKYGRLLFLAQENAEDRFDLPGPDFRSRAAGDTLFQVRMIEAREARSKRIIWFGAVAGAGLLTGHILFNELPLPCDTDPVTGAKNCDDGPNIEPARAMIGGGALLVGLVAGVLMFTFEFDEEKLARRLAASR